MATCLVVEDDGPQRRMLAATLRTAGHHVWEAGGGLEALREARTHEPDLVLLDLGLPDMDGLELISRFLVSLPQARVIVITGRASVPSAVEALRAGARHYLVKPWDREELLLVVERESRAIQADHARALVEGGAAFWGDSPPLRTVQAKLARLAHSPATPVLVTGETGVGKEVVARELHRLSAASGPFVPVNCAGVPRELLESELFGHERGAFTGAHGRRRGFAELADGGTLFLDEVGDMDPALQAKLLRFLEDRRFFRIGGETEITVRCRVVAATHRDLEGMIEQGTFRSDLFYRLAVVTLEIPPLRKRPEDILPLAYHLLGKIARETGRPVRQLSPAAEAALTSHTWPGNVRELRNRLERALILGTGPRLEPSDLDLTGGSTGPSQRLEDERSRVLQVLEEEDWVVSRAARRLGVPRHWLRYRIKKYGLKPPEP